MPRITRTTKKVLSALVALTLIVSGFAVNAVSASVASALPLPYADINADGAVNLLDVSTLYSVISSGNDTALTAAQRLCADTDGDGRLSMVDLMKVYAAVSGRATHKSAAPAPSEYELEVFRLVNIERENAGVAPLTYGYDIQLFADIRAEECSYHFDHTRPNGNSCFSVFDEYQNNYFAGGENIAIYQRSPEEVVNDWMNSPGHRSNMLSPNFSAIVVGCREVPGYPGYYAWAQMFTY